MSRGPDAGRARHPALRRAGRRLGRRRRELPRLRHAEAMIGIHLNLLMAAPREPAACRTRAEPSALPRGARGWVREETGYQRIQGTRPQTLAYALTDSPAGLAAWIVEKFHAWSDHRRRRRARHAARPYARQHRALLVHRRHRHVILAHYYARLHGAPLVPPGETIDVPAGYAEFPREIRKPPRSAAAKGLHRSPPLDASCRRAATSPRSSSPRRWPTRSATSSASCAERSGGGLGLVEQAGGLGAADAGDVVLIFQQHPERLVHGLGA